MERTRRRRRGLAFLAAVVAAALANPSHASEVRCTTARYDIRVNGAQATQEEANSYGKVLEAAWPTFRAFFHAEPPLKEGERLAIRIFDKREACLVGAMNDKADMPPIKHPSWFSPSNRTVYLYRHESDWFTRYLILYGACLQFHGVSKPKNRDLDEWYTHGIAESFAVHSFDGEHLELATSPPVSWIDHPARALKLLGGKQIGLDPFTDERLADSSVRWAVVRFATSSSGGKYRERFERLALGATGSRTSGHDFMRSLGEMERISQEFSAWLLAAQMPLEVASSDWEAFSDGRILGRSGKDDQALCSAKPEFHSMRVTIDAPSEADGGVPGILFAFQDDRNYLVARIVSPVVFFENVVGGRQRGIDSRPIQNAGENPGAKTYVSIERTGEGVELEINGKVYDRFAVADGRLGLAAIGGRVVFRDLKCH